MHDPDSNSNTDSESVAEKPLIRPCCALLHGFTHCLLLLAFGWSLLNNDDVFATTALFLGCCGDWIRAVLSVGAVT